MNEFTEINAALAAAAAEGRPATAIIMSTSTWLNIHRDIGRTPGDPKKEPGRIRGVEIRIDDDVQGVRLVS